MSVLRARWAAIGAAVAVAVTVAVTLGAGGLAAVSATFPAGASTFVPISPCRLFDTRPEAKYNKGPRKTPLKAGETWVVQVTGDNGNCKGIPAAATAVTLNVTTDNTSELTFLAVWPDGEARPDTSALNPVTDHPAQNEINTRLGPGGKIQIYSDKGSTNVVGDITGYYVDHNHDDRYYTKAQVDARLPHTTVVSISTADFTGFDKNVVVHSPAGSGSGGGAWVGSSNTSLGSMQAGVQLPDGATITAMSVEYIDNSPTNFLNVALRCESMGQVSSITTITLSQDTPTNGWIAADQPIGAAHPSLVVDNKTCAYQLYVASDGWASVDQTATPLKIGAVHITVKMPG